MNTKNSLKWKHIGKHWVAGDGPHYVENVGYQRWEIVPSRVDGSKINRPRAGYALLYIGKEIQVSTLVGALKRYAGDGNAFEVEAAQPVTYATPKQLSPPPSITVNALLGDMDHRTKAPVPEITALKLEVERLSALVAECQRTATKNYNALRQALAAIASTAAGAARALYPAEEIKPKS